MRSSAQLTLARARAMFAASSRAMITTDKLIANQNSCEWPQKKEKPGVGCSGNSKKNGNLLRRRSQRSRRPIIGRTLRCLLLLRWRSIAARRDVRYDRLFSHYAVKRVFEDDSVAYQRVSRHAVELYARFLVCSSRCDQVAVCRCQIAFRLQDVEVRRCAKSIFLLLGIEALLGEFEGLLGGFYLRTIL